MAALLAGGADVNQQIGRSARGVTPLHCVCHKGHTEGVTVLLAAGANVNQASDGCTPLYIACQRGHADVVTKLIAANADVISPTPTPRCASASGSSASPSDLPDPFELWETFVMPHAVTRSSRAAGAQ